MSEKNVIKDSKLEKFRQLSEKRVNQILNKIRILSNLGNKSNYKYEQKDVEKMFRSIEIALKEARRKFQSKNKNDNYKFKW
jgi:hypothetical protein